MIYHFERKLFFFFLINKTHIFVFRAVVAQKQNKNDDINVEFVLYLMSIIPCQLTSFESKR